MLTYVCSTPPNGKDLSAKPGEENDFICNELQFAERTLMKTAHLWVAGSHIQLQMDSSVIHRSLRSRGESSIWSAFLLSKALILLLAVLQCPAHTRGEETKGKKTDVTLLSRVEPSLLFHWSCPLFHRSKVNNPRKLQNPSQTHPDVNPAWTGVFAQHHWNECLEN